MFVAADDTDSMRGNCTTYLATEIIRVFTETGLDLIGPPRLVRLNPAIPWKTRGNGALVMRFGRGRGTKTLLGQIEGRDLWCSARQTAWEPDPQELLKLIRPLVERYHDPVDSDPGIVITAVRPRQGFYWEGVRRIVPRAAVETELKRIGATVFQLGCGRGIIGCTCATAWRPRDSTYELLAYRPPARWGTERQYDPATVARAEHEIPTSFNSWEDRDRKVAMVPGTPCPVMYGFRGDDLSDLLKGHELIKTEPQSRWVVFLTNQGTDDHIVPPCPRAAFRPNSSYAVSGTVTGRERIQGGHTFITLRTAYGPLKCGAYGPSREFRHTLDWLVPGDTVEVLGELRDVPRTLNIEKLHVVRTVPELVKVSNPRCPQCGRTMSSVGRDQGFRCRRCGTRAAVPVQRQAVRWIVPGWYEPPAGSRRHLSKPLKRMDEVQPVEFVNCRNP